MIITTEESVLRSVAVVKINNIIDYASSELLEELKIQPVRKEIKQTEMTMTIER